MTKEEIYTIIEEEDVEFIRLQFTDIFGNLKNMAVTPSQLNRVFAGCYSFAGAAMFADTFDYEDELYLVPDPDTFVILPWRPQQGKVAKIICDVYTEDGKPLEVSPRYILEKVLAEAKKKGYTFIIDPECEFFLFHTDENGLPTTKTHEMAGYMDVGPVDFGENARRDIVLMLEDMGYEVEASFHEKAPAQHEIDFKGDDASKIADSIMNFRFAVRSIAKRFGLYATFMPKPITDNAGSSIHFHIAAYKDGKNIFSSKEGISSDANYFMGGVLKHIKGLCAVSNPTVNSYKRILTGFDAPRTISWSEKGERAAVRLKRNGGDTRIELRYPDAACNPYLAIALAIAAGIEGIENQTDPGCDLNKKCDTPCKNELLPEKLEEAMDELQADSLLTGILGDEFVKIYTEAKYKEWQDYIIQISDWEISRYLIKM